MNHTHSTLQHYLQADAQRFGTLRLWLLFRCLPTAVALGIALLLLSVSPARANLEEPEAFSPNDVASGQMLLSGASGASYKPAVILQSQVHFDISGLIATVSVEQTFRNNTAGFVEGVYAFPLPDTAAVRFLEMEIGERRIVGKVREKAQARKIYQAARASGKKASLVEQQRPNLFTNRVANIGPGETIVVRMEYVETVGQQADAFSLRLPMTITPRYMPGTPLGGVGVQESAPIAVNPYLGWAHDTDQVPDASAISPLQHRQPGSDRTPKNPVTITATLDMGMPLASVESPYHEIALKRRAGVYHIALASGQSEMDRDFVLNWVPVTGAAPRAAFFTEQVAGNHYGLLMVLPPAAARPATTIPREMVFVVDTSGSMGGVSIEQARASVARALAELRPSDRFNIIAFASNYRKLFSSPVPATAHNVQRAQEFVRLLDASGGTEMLPALRAALALPEDREASTQRLRQVVFITDGAVGNEEALFQEIARRLADRRLFTVGIGSAPNSWFMRKAAEFGRGSHTHIGNVDEVEQKMVALFDQLARPAAVDVRVQWPGAVEAWPARTPDLYQGEPLVIAVNFGTDAPAGELVVSAMIGGAAWRQVVHIGQGEDPHSRPAHAGVASVWARKKIAGLLDQKTLGKDPAEVRNAVLPIALAHQLLSPYTSFVAVEELIGRPEGDPLQSKAVPNTRPRGQAPQPFAFPNTATTGPAKAWLGMLCLFLALVLRLVRQPEVDHVPA